MDRLRSEEDYLKIYATGSYVGQTGTGPLGPLHSWRSDYQVQQGKHQTLHV